MTTADTALLPSVESLPWTDLGKLCPLQFSDHSVINMGKSSVLVKKKKHEGECKIALPPGAVPLENQVAGHSKGPQSMMMLKCEGGHVMKHVQPPPKGYREVEFYRKMFQSDVTDPVLLKLRQFIPTFFGTVPDGPVEHVTFFKMADVTQRFSRPCISDIKMGRITYDPLATEEKRHYEIAKYPPGLNLGFQMLGMRVYKAGTGSFDIFDRKYGRSLAEDEVIDKGLAVFFTAEDGLRRDAIQCTLTKLKRIQAWFESQTQLSFYASSLLLMYEGDTKTSHCAETLQCGCATTRTIDNNDQPTTAYLTSQSCENTEQNGLNSEASSCVADVKMIDFAHVFETTERDENYLFGLRHLINHMEMLLR